MTKTRICSVALIWMASSASAEVFQHTLISVSRNMNIPDYSIAGKSVTPDCPIAWSVRKLTLHGGKQEGVDVVVVDNGKLQMTIVPTRGMGIRTVVMGDVRLGWDSPVKELVHPRHIDLQSRGGLGWLDGFNEWMCRCGLEFNGHPGTDKFIDNVGAENTMELTLHGKIANTPASEVEMLVEQEAPYRIRIRGQVDERLMFGPQLELKTEISTEPGTATFRICDVLTNRGARDQEFQILYHCNFGKGLLEEGARFVAPVERVTPFNDTAAKGLESWAEYGAPQLGFIEKCYCLRLYGDKDDRTLVMLHNKRKDRAVSLAYSTKALPYFTIWKNTADERDGYVTGLEPGTGLSYTRRIERMRGRVPKLAPGEPREIAIDFAVHTNIAEVMAVADRVAVLKGSRKTKIDTSPQDKE